MRLDRWGWNEWRRRRDGLESPRTNEQQYSSFPSSLPLFRHLVSRFAGASTLPSSIKTSPKTSQSSQPSGIDPLISMVSPSLLSSSRTLRSLPSPFFLPSTPPSHQIRRHLPHFSRLPPSHQQVQDQGFAEHRGLGEAGVDQSSGSEGLVPGELNAS